MVDKTRIHSENGLVQKKFRFYNTGFAISVSIATGISGESTCLCIQDSNIYLDGDSRAELPREYIIPIDAAEDLIELAEVLKSAIAERNKTLISNMSMYQEIEGEVIQWSNDGTLTAGSLTRTIMQIIKDREENK